jgi:hypothetical protein
MVGSRRPKVVSSAHEVFGEGHLRIEIGMKTSAPALAARGPTTPYAAEPSGVGVGSAVVIV